MPARNVKIVANYRDTRDSVSFAPRAGHGNRMLGEVFEGDELRSDERAVRDDPYHHE
jgi:hypothetical protein